jgi:alkylation response protein AidB-like acyl-CoA dehydrogenase
MTWMGPPLDEDQVDVVGMLDSLAEDRGTELADDPSSVGALVASLAELGIWTVGAPESGGGGGADTVTTALVFERLGRHWPSLGWASVQAHAAMVLLDGAVGMDDLCNAINSGSTRIAVVDVAAPHVDLAIGHDTVSGAVHRVDAADENPHVIVLDGTRRAILIRHEAIFGREPLRRTGLAGAMTRTLHLDATAEYIVELDPTRSAEARRLLASGASAVAAGIAGGAFDCALAYTAERHQFGGPLTNIPTVRQGLLEQASTLAVVLRAVLAPIGTEVEAWAVLQSATEAAIDVAAAALQAHGGYGYLTEYGVERRLRDAVSLRAAAGAQPTARSTAEHLAVG